MIAYASYEDYLYILIGIVWVLFSIYNAKKKNKAKETAKSITKDQASNESSKSPSFLDSLISEMGLNEEKPDLVYSDPFSDSDKIIEKKIVPLQSDKYVEDETEKVFSYDDYYEESNYKLSSDVNEHKKTVKNYKKTTTDTIKKSSKVRLKKVDLKKAIIYSEILKRQYF